MFYYCTLHICVVQLVIRITVCPVHILAGILPWRINLTGSLQIELSTSIQVPKDAGVAREQHHH